MSDGLDTRELEAFAEQLVRVADENPRRAKRFMQKQGTILKGMTLRTAKQRVKRKTGNYFNSIKRGKVYTYGGKNIHAIRVFSAAPHAHLIEDGHRVFSYGQGSGFAPGKHVFSDARKDFQGKFETASEDFLDEMIREVEQ